MNLFSGFTSHQIISFLLAVGVFTVYAGLVALAVIMFYVTSRPSKGRIRTASMWHIVALALFLLSTVTTVWGAPAEKSFLGNTGDQLFDWSADRIFKMEVGAAFAVLGLICLVVGILHGGAQKRAWRDETLAAD